MEERHSVLYENGRTLILVGERANHDSIDSSLWVLAAVEHYLGVRLGRDGKVGHTCLRDTTRGAPEKVPSQHQNITHARKLYCETLSSQSRRSPK